jgi:hypothetical protein
MSTSGISVFRLPRCDLLIDTMFYVGDYVINFLCDFCFVLFLTEDYHETLRHILRDSLATSVIIPPV